MPEYLLNRAGLVRPKAIPSPFMQQQSRPSMAKSAMSDSAGDLSLLIKLHKEMSCKKDDASPTQKIGSNDESFSKILPYTRKTSMDVTWLRSCLQQESLHQAFP